MKISFRKYVVFLILPLVAISVLLYFVASNNISRYYAHETELAEASVSSTEAQIQLYLRTLRKNVGYFTEHYSVDIRRLVDNTDDTLLSSKLSAYVEKYFPDAVAYTVADSQGNVLLNDEKSLIGKGCRENIRLFAISSEQSDAKLRIHSDPLNYHFDIMHEMRTSDGRVVIFFVTFEPVDIASFIASHQVPGHQLMIIKKHGESLIEVTEIGARVLLKREKHLTAEERERIFAGKEIDHTQWRIVDILDEKEINKALLSVYIDTGIIFSAFILGILLAFASIVKHEKARGIMSSS